MRRIYLLYPCLLGLLTIVTTSCSSFDKEEAVPAYLRIDSITFQRSSPLQGTESQNITEAWVFIDDQLQGIYDLPCEVPVLALGAHNLKIRGGILRNLNSDQRVDYPLWATYSQDVELSSNQTLVVNPVVGYFEDVTTSEENFEDAGVQMVKSPNSDTTIFTTTRTDEVFEGNGSGKMVLTPNQFRAVVETNKRLTLPRGVPVFLELNFNTTADLRVGLVGRTNANGNTYNVIVGIKPTQGKWKKGYINLSEFVNLQAFGATFDVYFDMAREHPNGDSCVIDNIKFVYPQ